MEYVNSTKVPKDLRHTWRQMLQAFSEIHKKGKVGFDFE